MDNEKFQDLMLDQFAKLFKEVQGVKSELKTDVAGIKTDVAGLKTDVAGLKTDVAELKTDVRNIKDSQIRMENKFDEQIAALHDFRIAQEQINQEVKDALASLGTKVEELQFDVRANDEKLENVSDDINFLARRSLLQEKQLKVLKRFKQS